MFAKTDNLARLRVALKRLPPAALRLMLQLVEWLAKEQAGKE